MPILLRGTFLASRDLQPEMIKVLPDVFPIQQGIDVTGCS